MNKLDFTYEEVLAAVENSTNIRSFLQYLGMNVNNGNYRRAKQICTDHGLTLPKHDRSKDIADLAKVNRISDEVFFSAGVLRNGPAIKKRLIRDYGFVDRCSTCGQLPVWMGKPLTLQVDHIDGDRFNNTLENLRILCGHCHIQTETYGHKGSKSSRTPVYSYCSCGMRMSATSSRCSSCANVAKKGTTNLYDFAPIEEIVSKVQELGSWSAASRFYGIGDNTLRKHLKRNGVEPADVVYRRRQQKV